ncbi:response regulator [Clostridioides difficile]
MINVIIAEDQQLILKDLCNKISKIDSEINIVATAINGQDAYEKVLEFKPDIVFTDINMPILSGIEMIKKVKAEGLSTHFVIISGYKDFEYARGAMKAGVDDYLLKPIIIDDIKNIFENLKSKLSMKKRDYEQHIIDKLINSQVTDSTSINVNLNYKYYYILLFVAGPYSSFTIDLATPFNETWNEVNLKSISKTYMSSDSRFFLIPGKKSNEIIGVLASNNAESSNINNFCNKVLDICNSTKIPVTIGVSNVSNNINNICITAQIVRTIVKKKIVFAKSSIIDCSKNELYLHKHRNFLSDDIEKSFKFMLQNNQSSSIINECNTLIDTLKKNNATQYEIDKCFKGLLDICAINNITENYVSDIELELDECISSCSNYNELHSGINIIFNKLIDEYNNNIIKNNYMDNIIEASKEYIKSHFSEDINVNNIASLFAVSPTYFSRLFKKEVGVPPVVFINKYRMERACAYFDETNFTVKEVSELCGYSDPFYFSKAFKSIVGIPPKEYRLRNCCKDSV